MAIRLYRDFVVYTDYLDGAKTDLKGRLPVFSVRVFDSPVGEGEREEVVGIQNWDQVDSWHRQLADRSISADEQRRFCRQLGDYILPEYARTLFIRSLDVLQENEGLRLRLRLVNEIGHLPWEYALVQTTGGEPRATDYLGLNPQLSIVRHEMVAIQAMPFRSGDKRRVIVAMASPRQYPNLDLRKEQAAIKAALDTISGVDAQYAPDFSDSKVPAGATEEDIKHALEKPADIFHFSGHGRFRHEAAELTHAQQGQGEILLTDAKGEDDEVTADELCLWLHNGHVRLAVLDACETSKSDIFQRWSSVARSLLKGGIPAVVAMQFSVYDDQAYEFTKTFYQNLVVGYTIDEAVAQGRRVMWSKSQEITDRDWGTPVLFLRNSGGSLFPPVRDEDALQQATASVAPNSTLSAIFLRWVRKGAIADSDQLQFLKSAGEHLDLGYLDNLLLLRSALTYQDDIGYWTNRLVGSYKIWLDQQLSGSLGVDASISTELGTLLGLSNEFQSSRPDDFDPLAWSAVYHPDALTRQTSALTLSVRSPTSFAIELEEALQSVKNPGERRRHRAELFGILSEAGTDTALRVAGHLDNLQDQFAVWWWRAKRLMRKRQGSIGRWTIGGALGGALALGLYRMLVAIPSTKDASMGTEFAIYSYWGFILGVALAFATVVTYILLLEDPIDPKTRHKRLAPLLAAVCGGLSFGSAHVLVAWMNSPSGRPLESFLPAVAVGIGLGFGLYDQPRAGKLLGVRGWLFRLAAVFLLLALTQLPALCEATYQRYNYGWFAAAIFQKAEWLRQGFYYVRSLQPIFDLGVPNGANQCCFSAGAVSDGTINRLLLDCFEQWLSIVDAGFVGLLMTVGFTFGMHFDAEEVNHVLTTFRTRAGHVLQRNPRTRNDSKH